MGYAVKKDGSGWRSVDSKNDIEADEKFSEVQPDLSNIFDAQKTIFLAKKAKIQALQEIIVTTASGKQFDGNETARNNMMSAIMSADLLGHTTANWKLADNTIAQVTVSEVREALALAIQRVGAIVTA